MKSTTKEFSHRVLLLCMLAQQCWILGWVVGGEALEVRTTKVSTSLYLSLYN